MEEANHLNIIHGDLDAFFAAVEQRDNPELRGKPVIVGGSPRSRGVVSTCSYEARLYGVKSAMPSARAYQLCPQAVFLPGDFTRYREASRQVFAILRDYSPIVEPLSIDEAFLDVTGCGRLFGSAEAIARTIKQRVKDEVGLTISMGISYNKFLAKLATELGKPDGLKVIRKEEAAAVLAPLPVHYLWGAGQRTVELLNRLGIGTIGQVQEMEPAELERHLGKAGPELWLLASGVDQRRVEPEREVKSVGRETTFPQDVDDWEILDRVLLEFAQDVGSRLRGAGLEAHTITVKIRYPDFRTITRSRTMNDFNASDLVIYRTASDILHQVSPPRKVRLIGLSVANLRHHDQPGENLSLFSETQVPDTKLDDTLDQIRHRFGKRAITRAALLRDYHPGDESKK